MVCQKLTKGWKCSSGMGRTVRRGCGWHPWWYSRHFSFIIVSRSGISGCHILLPHWAILDVRCTLDGRQREGHSPQIFQTMQIALKWSWALGLCCVLRLQDLPEWRRIALSLFRCTRCSFHFRWARFLLTCAGGLGYYYSIFVKWTDSSLPKARHNQLRSNCFTPSLWERIELKLCNYRPRILCHICMAHEQRLLRGSKN